jgi:hypothetical protein
VDDCFDGSSVGPRARMARISEGSANPLRPLSTCGGVCFHLSGAPNTWPPPQTFATLHRVALAFLGERQRQRRPYDSSWGTVKRNREAPSRFLGAERARPAVGLVVGQESARGQVGQGPADRG